MLWQGASLAVEEANAAGGLEGRPFRLLGAWSDNPWGSGVRDLARLVYEDRVWAILGGPDSAASHLAEQVVSKARLAYVSPVATEKSSHFVNVPWIYSLAPPDPEIASVLARSLLERAGERGFLLVSGTDHDSRKLTEELLSALARSPARTLLHIQVNPGEGDLAEVLERAFETPAAAAVVIAGVGESARIIALLRRGGLEVPIVAGPQAGRRSPAPAVDGRHGGRPSRSPMDGPAPSGPVGVDGTEAVPPSTDGTEAVPPTVFYPVLWSPGAEGSPSARFAERFRRRFGVEPDYAAAYAYDAAAVLVAAVRKAGLNRVLIRDALRDIVPVDGVTGEIRWDPTGRRRGRKVVLSAPGP
jgi:branched-chain amino acid transport system substrate-binding protein